MSIIGYARTSTADQQAGLADQIATLEAAGCGRIFSEHASAAGRDRPQLSACLDYLREGDSFMVTRPDRLARSVRDLLAIVDQLRAKGVNVRILSIGADTATATGKLILTVLAGVAEMEREIMLERQRAGIATARSAGKYKGRKRSIDPSRLMEARLLLLQGRTQREVADWLGVDRVTLYRALKAA